MGAPDIRERHERDLCKIGILFLVAFSIIFGIYSECKESSDTIIRFTVAREKVKKIISHELKHRYNLIPGEFLRVSKTGFLPRINNLVGLEYANWNCGFCQEVQVGLLELSMSLWHPRRISRGDIKRMLHFTMRTVSSSTVEFTLFFFLWETLLL